MAVWGDNVLIARNEGPGAQRPGCRFSSDRGLTLSDGGAPPAPAGWAWWGVPVVTVNERTGAFYWCALLDLGTGAHGIGIVPATLSRGTLAWGVPVLTRSTDDARAALEQPWLVADSTTGNLYLTCTTFDGAAGNGIDFQRSIDGGATWNAPMRISSAADRGRVVGSRPAVGPAGELYATWSSFGTGAADHIRMRRSISRGASWGAEVTPATRRIDLGAGTPGSDRVRGIAAPSITVDRTTGSDRGRVHLAWTGSAGRNDDADAETEHRSDARDVFACYSDDGITWSAPVTINDDASRSRKSMPEIQVAADGMPYATWSGARDSTGGADACRFVSRSSDGGATWSASRRLPDAPGDVATRSLAGNLRFDLSTCQGDLAADPGSAVSPGWTVINRNPQFTDTYGWTLAGRRNWPAASAGAAAAAANGRTSITPTIAIPDTAAPGVNRICFTVTDARGTRSRQCCFDLAIEPAPTGVPILVAAFDLRTGAPNPATRKTRIDFSIPDPGPVRLGIYGLRGELVRTLADGARPSGPHTVTWDGRDERGTPAGAGAYFCRLEGFGGMRVQRLIWVR